LIVRTWLILVGIGLCPLFGQTHSWAQEVEPQVTELLLTGVEAALSGDKRRALDSLQKAAILNPKSSHVQAIVGSAALLLGDYDQARRVLSRVESMTTYYAMAVAHQPGGFAKAKSVLAKAAKDKKASPSVLYLAALAFQSAGQTRKAERLLEMAVKRSSSSLDEAFCPDPAVGMTRSLVQFVHGQASAGKVQSRLAIALFHAGRRGEAYRWAEEALNKPKLRAAALRVLVLIENISYSQRTLSRVRRVLKDDPTALDAQVAEVLLLVRLKEMKKAKRRLEALPSIDEKELKSQLLQARAEINLALKANSDDVVISAEEALRAAPKSNRALALMVKALIQVRKFDRAKSFALALAKRQPVDVDPYELLALIQKKRKKTKEIALLNARSQLVKKSMKKLEALAKSHEEVIRAVRQAEQSSVAATALAAVRRESPQLALPVDLAIIRLGTKGHARVARNRVLGACASHLKAMLLNREGKDWVEVDTNPYGRRQRARVPLSASNPSRCHFKKLKRR
jgi:tetratricopeptide (TPR) repeat protein